MADVFIDIDEKYYKKLKRLNSDSSKDIIITELFGAQNNQVHITKFLGDDFESVLIERSKKIANDLLDLIKNDLIVKKQKIFHNAKYHLISKIYPKIKLVYICERILEEYPNAKQIYASPKYFNYIKHKNKVKVGQNRIFGNQNYLIVYLGLIFELIISPLISWALFQNKREHSDNEFIIFGSINEMFSLLNEGEYTKYFNLKEKKIRFIGQTLKIMKYRKINISNQYSFELNTLDNYLTIKDHFYLTKYMVQVIKKTNKTYKHFSHNELSEDAFLLLQNSKREFMEVFLYFSFLSVKYLFAIENIYKMSESLSRGNKVFLTYASPMHIHILNQYFKEKGIKTITYNHGIIQDINQIITNTKLNISTSNYDYNILEKFSEDDKYLLLKKNIEVYEYSKVKDINNVVIFLTYFHATTNINEILQYISLIIDIISKSKIKPHIIIKPHPKNNKKVIDKYCLKIGYEYGIEVIQKNIDDMLEAADLIITPMSSVILKIIEHSKPFLLFESGYESKETFYEHIPDNVKFNNYESFEEKLDLLLGYSDENISDLFNSIYKAYY